MKLSSMRVFLGLIAVATLVGCGRGAVQNEAQTLASIIGGQEVDINNSLSRGIVALYDVERKALCTGSIISERFILTAAHCVRREAANNMRVVFGTNTTTQDGVYGVLRVTGVLTPSSWATRNSEVQDTGDIALVRLAGPLPQGYKTVRMLDSLSRLSAGQKVMLAGYGVTTMAPALEGDDGAGVLRDVVTTIINPNWSSTEILIDESQGKGACHGDSGGPAFIQSNGVLMVIGVTSRGTVADCTENIVYTSVVAYKDFLRNAAQQLDREALTSQASM